MFEWFRFCIPAEKLSKQFMVKSGFLQHETSNACPVAAATCISTRSVPHAGVPRSLSENFGAISRSPCDTSVSCGPAFRAESVECQLDKALHESRAAKGWRKYLDMFSPARQTLLLNSSSCTHSGTELIGRCAFADLWLAESYEA